MRTLTQEQFKKEYGDAGLTSFDSSTNIQPQVTPNTSMKGFSDISNTIKEAGSSYLPGLMKTYARTIGLDSETDQWGKPDFIKAAESSKVQAGSPMNLPGGGTRPRTATEAAITRVGEGALRSTASLLNSIFAPITQGVTSLAEASTNNPDLQKFATDNPVGSTLADVGDRIDTWKKENPEKTQDIESALTILLTAISGGKGGLDKPVSEIFKPKQVFTGPTKSPSNTVNVGGKNLTLDDIHQMKSSDIYKLPEADQVKLRAFDNTESMKLMYKNAVAKGDAKGISDIKAEMKAEGIPIPKAENAPISIPTQGISAGIMNRVARLKPTDELKFQKITGETPGEYLTRTGNFGAPDKIISTEATKFTQSMNMVDAEFAKLPGVYKNGAVRDALTGLYEKAKSVSTDNVSSSYLKQVEDLIKKYEAGGLTMEEINTVKRLYESKVKLGYNKLLNADKIEQATLIDSSIRKWQLQKARDLGFKNVDELNKQTQISKFIVNKLGEQVIGQKGLNSISLTDWVMLGTGVVNPLGVVAFLTKKFFSNRAVQAKIAEMLNKGEPVEGMIQPKVNSTIENNLRRQFPQGTTLELPPGTNPVTENRVPIQLRGASTIEPPAQKIMTEPIKSNTKIPQPPQQEKILRTSSQNNISDINKTAPITKTSSRTIDNSIPQKKGIIKRIVEKYKKSPFGSQKGAIGWDFSKLGNKGVTIEGKTFKEIPKATKIEMAQVIDYLRIGKGIKGIEETLLNLSKKYNIPEDLIYSNSKNGNSKIANYFEDLIRKTKTSLTNIPEAKK